MGSRSRPLNDETKGLNQCTKNHDSGHMGIDGLILVEIVLPNLRVIAKYRCEFAIPHMEANEKTHRPKQGLKGIIFHWNNAPSRTAKVIIVKIREL
jgi:hypothetical protein